MSRSKETYHWYKQHGICVMCHRANAMENRTTCAECREKIKIKNRKYHEKHLGKRNEELNQKKRIAYAERRASGICVECGKNPAKEGRVRCGHCLIILSEREHHYKMKREAGK